MGVRSLLARLLPREDSAIVVECRHCGQTVGPEIDACPDCESDELARYEIRC